MKCPICNKDIKTVSHIRRMKDDQHVNFVKAQEELAVRLYVQCRNVFEVLNHKDIILKEYLNILLRNKFKDEIYKTNRINRNKKIAMAHTNENSAKFKFRQKFLEDINEQENIDFVTCQICGFKGRQLISHLTRIHNIGKAEYQKSYNNAPLNCFNTNKKIAERAVYNSSGRDNIKMSLNNKQINKNIWGKCGIRNDLNEFYRSCWEANIARILRYKNIKYIYEVRKELSYNNQKLIYLVDFYLPDYDVYLEVKGFWDDTSKLKVDLFQKTNKLIIIDSNYYKQISKEYKKLIEYWE